MTNLKRTRHFLHVLGVDPAWPWASREFTAKFGICDPLFQGANVATSAAIATYPGNVTDEAPPIVVVFDAGRGVDIALHERGILDVDLWLLSHAHIDHIDNATIDSAIRRRKLSGRDDPIVVIGTDPTLSAIPQFLRAGLTFQVVRAGDSFLVQVRSVTIDIAVIDASQHFPGAVSYIVTINGRRVGFFADRRSFDDLNDEDRIRASDLDVAIFDTNTVSPNRGTGHTSVVEAARFARLIRCRVALMTHCALAEEGGAGDPISFGTRAVLLAEPVPGLRALYAWPGMSLDLDLLAERLIRAP